MWVVDCCNLSYAGQDINTAIKGHYGNVKCVLKAKRCRLAGRRVDWIVKMMVKIATRHLDFCKMYGFVDNQKKHDFLVSYIIKARDILDADVTLPQFEGGLVLVTSM